MSLESIARMGVVLFVVLGGIGVYLMLVLHGMMPGPKHKALVHVAPAMLMLAGISLMMWEEKRGG